MQCPIVEVLGLSAESSGLWDFDGDAPLEIVRGGRLVAPTRQMLDVFSKGIHRVLIKFDGPSHEENAEASNV